ncbi:MAG: calcium-translocating P-type ATPase, SERCA-type [Chloroflexota bacterium]
MTDPLWYALSADEACAALQSDREAGLTLAEAQARLQRHGPNAVAERRRTTVWELLLEQFKDLIIIVLMGATVVSALMGEVADAAAIVVIVVMNAGFGVIQEYRAERSIAALKSLTAPVARVRREGATRVIPAAELVPGDIVVLAEGDRIPADTRLLETISLATDESLLTGESALVEKHSEPLRAADLGIGDQANMVFMGATVQRGHGLGVVVRTGMRTEVGRIAAMVQEVDDEMTPLQKRLDELGKTLVIICLGICGIVTVTGIIHGEPLYAMFLAGVSLAVAAIPEGLPAIVTVVLAMGVQRMIRRNALIRKLHAVETLGSTSVICTDKTGTLTVNQMTVSAIVTTAGEYAVSGDATSVDGRFSLGGRDVDPLRCPDLRLALEIATLCNNAELKPLPGARADRVRVDGDSTEGALLIAAAKAGLTREDLDERCPRLAEVPFDSDRKRMSVVCRDRGNARVLVKGAFESVIALCDSVQCDGRVTSLSPEWRQRLADISDGLASRAMRVIALACRSGSEVPREPEAIERGLTFVGFAAMADPLRAEVPDAVERCRLAGIRTVMITGDHRATAVAVAGKLGLRTGAGAVLTGPELDRLSDQQLYERVEQIDVYARVSPRHKLRIVQALKRRGAVVAMTGDGVNDAPALKEADIGVAMGRTGSDVARETSAMILTDDNFATIVAAVEEGRGIYDNIRKFIRYLLSCNVGEVVTMFAAALFALPMPLTPIQILWCNLVTDGLPAIALGVDPLDPGTMDRPPRPAHQGILAGGFLQRIARRGLLIGVSTLAIYIGALRVFRGDVAHARTLAYATLIMSQLIYVFSCRSERLTLLELGLFTNPWLVAAVAVSTLMLLATIYIPALAAVFATMPLRPLEWAAVLLLSGSGAFVRSGYRAMRRRRGRPERPRQRR